MRVIRGRTALFFLLIVLLGAAAAYIDWPSSPGINFGGYKNTLQVKQGLDLQGGVQLVYQASCPQDKPKCDIPSYMSAVISNVNQRIAGGLAVNDAVVRQEGNDSVLIQLPGFTNDQQATQLLGSTGQMYIIDTGTSFLPTGTDVSNQLCTTTCATGQYKIVFKGSELDPNSISAGLDQQSGQPVVNFEFSGNYKSAFANYTNTHIGQALTTVLDGKVINSATIQSQISGPGVINGLKSVAEAQSLATDLKYGALPLPLSLQSEQLLAPTLGQDALNRSKVAAGIGLGMVVLFMLIFYRLPGLLADVALALYALFLFAVIKMLGVTLSLPGIAALILTIGMAVDANVLIFERVKEELRSGRTMAAAVDIGFKRAWPSIRDSNASTMITCAILYWFGNTFGATLIVGFAVNLFIGVAISLFTAVVVTRNFLNLLVPTGIATHPALYGLSQKALPVSRYNRPVSRVAGRPSRATLATSKATETTDADDTTDAGDDSFVDETLEPVGNSSSNGRTPAAGRAGMSRGVEE